MIWVKCSKENCPATICSHRVAHESKNFLSSCANVKARCQETGDLVICLPFKEESAKKAFIVYVREVHIQPYRVLAETPKEAIRLVSDGDGEILDCCLEYSHTLDPDTWTLEEA